MVCIIAGPETQPKTTMGGILHISPCGSQASGANACLRLTDTATLLWGERRQRQGFASGSFGRSGKGGFWLVTSALEGSPIPGYNCAAQHPWGGESGRAPAAPAKLGTAKASLSGGGLELRLVCFSLPEHLLSCTSLPPPLQGFRL